MSLREILGVVLAIVGAAVDPLGWVVSAKGLVVAFALLAVGVGLFYTERRRKREEEIAKEGGGRAASGPEVPGDIHNYTGWRSGGRRQDMESTADSGGADGD